MNTQVNPYIHRGIYGCSPFSKFSFDIARDACFVSAVSLLPSASFIFYDGSVKTRV
jgi:hypothetical protein